MKHALLGALFIIFGLLSVPGAYGNCSDKSCTNKIKRLYLDQSKLHILLEGNHSKLTCKLTGPYITAPVNLPVFSDWHAMLLSAFLGDRTVTVRVTTSGACQIVYVVMDR